MPRLTPAGGPAVRLAADDVGTHGETHAAQRDSAPTAQNGAQARLADRAPQRRGLGERAGNPAEAGKAPRHLPPRRPRARRARPPSLRTGHPRLALACQRTSTSCCHVSARAEPLSYTRAAGPMTRWPGPRSRSTPDHLQPDALPVSSEAADALATLRRATRAHHDRIDALMDLRRMQDRAQYARVLGVFDAFLAGWEPEVAAALPARWHPWLAPARAGLSCSRTCAAGRRARRGGTPPVVRGASERLGFRLRDGRIGARRPVHHAQPGPGGPASRPRRRVLPRLGGCDRAHVARGARRPCR